MVRGKGESGDRIAMISSVVSTRSYWLLRKIADHRSTTPSTDSDETAGHSKHSGYRIGSVGTRLCIGDDVS